MMNAALLNDVMEHAARCQPLEACGIIADDEFFPLDNQATEPNWFVMDMRGYCRVAKSRKVTAIVHSHVDLPPIAGDADRAMCDKFGVPWVIVSWPFGTYCVIEPQGVPQPLIGRSWAWGVNDCFSLIRDGFRHYTGIELKDYDREWEFWRKQIDLIGSNITDAGFIRLAPGTRPQHCDLFGMRVKSDVVNHLALFIEPDRILHQFHGRLSVQELYDGTYQSLTKLHLRHKRFSLGEQTC
jgi:proteasome lid subunit RPN8/RPN11